MTRDKQHERLSGLAGLTSEGGILPPEGGGIDRSANPHWNNGLPLYQYEWVLNPELKATIRRDPVMAAARKRQADAWRGARKEHPKMARLLWRRVRRAERQFANEFWSKP